MTRTSFKMAACKIAQPELLAPAGNLEAFFAALDAGANAVYLGLKAFSARKLARNFTFEELAQVVDYAHDRKNKVYVAMNSLVSPLDLPKLVETLCVVESVGVDAIIVQDLSTFYLVTNYFPKIRLHGSTLMAVHNSLGTQQLQKMGAKRVVLARELTLKEIEKIKAQTSIEIEVFVHGALCYSYSGLCLASSFLGGKSGLKGNCVQPCRRRYWAKGETGYFLSANDLSAIEIIPELKRIGVNALKIEGRMKSADYVYQVVLAYKKVIEAGPGEEKTAIENGFEILRSAPGRKASRGYFLQNERRISSLEILAPHRSGTSGLWIGTVQKKKDKRVLVQLRHRVEQGDRIRPESQEGKEKPAFVVKKIQKGATRADLADSGETVWLDAGVSIQAGDKLFKVGKKLRGAAASYSRLKKRLPAIETDTLISGCRESARLAHILKSLQDQRNRRTKFAERIYLKIGRYNLLNEALRMPVDYVVLTATRENMERVAQRKLTREQLRRFAWSLPPVILEKDLEYYNKAISWFSERKFRLWWVNNLSHFPMIGNQDMRIIGDSSLNTLNQASLWMLKNLGCRAAVLSWEVSKTELASIVKNRPPIPPFVTVYGYPPIFVSRIFPPTKKTEISWEGDKRNRFKIVNRDGTCLIYPSWPVNLFDALEELRIMGLRNFIIDCSHSFCNKKELVRVISGYKRERVDLPRTLFNYARKRAQHKAR